MYKRFNCTVLCEDGNVHEVSTLLDLDAMQLDDRALCAIRDECAERCLRFVEVLAIEPETAQTQMQKMLDAVLETIERRNEK